MKYLQTYKVFESNSNMNRSGVVRELKDNVEDILIDFNDYGINTKCGVNGDLLEIRFGDYDFFSSDNEKFTLDKFIDNLYHLNSFFLYSDKVGKSFFQTLNS